MKRVDRIIVEEPEPKVKSTNVAKTKKPESSKNSQNNSKTEKSSENGDKTKKHVKIISPSIASSVIERIPEESESKLGDNNDEVEENGTKEDEPREKRKFEVELKEMLSIEEIEMQAQKFRDLASLSKEVLVLASTVFANMGRDAEKIHNQKENELLLMSKLNKGFKESRVPIIPEKPPKYSILTDKAGVASTDMQVNGNYDVAAAINRIRESFAKLDETISNNKRPDNKNISNNKIDRQQSIDDDDMSMASHDSHSVGVTFLSSRKEYAAATARAAIDHQSIPELPAESALTRLLKAKMSPAVPNNNNTNDSARSSNVTRSNSNSNSNKTSSRSIEQIKAIPESTRPASSSSSESTNIPDQNYHSLLGADTRKFSSRPNSSGNTRNTSSTSSLLVKNDGMTAPLPLLETVISRCHSEEGISQQPSARTARSEDAAVPAPTSNAYFLTEAAPMVPRISPRTAISTRLPNRVNIPLDNNSSSTSAPGAGVNGLDGNKDRLFSVRSAMSAPNSKGLSTFKIPDTARNVLSSGELEEAVLSISANVSPRTQGSKSHFTEQEAFAWDKQSTPSSSLLLSPSGISSRLQQENNHHENNSLEYPSNKKYLQEYDDIDDNSDDDDDDDDDEEEDDDEGDNIGENGNLHSVASFTSAHKITFVGPDEGDNDKLNKDDFRRTINAFDRFEIEDDEG